MVPDLSPYLPFILAFIAVGVVAGLVSLAILGRAAYGFVAVNHRARVARHETIPTYYRRLLHSH